MSQNKKNRRRKRRRTGTNRRDGSPARSEAEREQHLIQMAAYRLKGWTQHQIAEALGISQATVSGDLAEVHRRWEAEQVKKIEQYKTMELARIDKILAEAWTSWERSKEKRRERVTQRSTGEDGESTRRSVKTVDQLGDPRFLREIARCIEARCKILGLFASDDNGFTDAVRNEIHKIVINNTVANRDHPQIEHHSIDVTPNVVINKSNS